MCHRNCLLMHFSANRYFSTFTPTHTNSRGNNNDDKSHGRDGSTNAAKKNPPETIDFIKCIMLEKIFEFFLN